MAKDISANVELEGGSIEVTPSLSDLTLAADADIRGLIPVERGKAAQSDWNETDSDSLSFISNKPNITSGTGDGSVIEGCITGDGANEASGGFSHAEGVGTKATANNAHAEGSATTASEWASHAEGRATTASGGFSHAEGIFTVAAGTDAHAEGVLCQANANHSHAEGNRTIVDGNSGHAEGRETKASADYTHSEGYRTLASSDVQHVQGKYNIEDANNVYAHIVGNGTAEDNRSNAHTLDWNGNAWYQGKVTAEGTPTEDNDLAPKSYIDDTLTDYVKNTDYATPNKSGVVKVSGTYGLAMNTSDFISTVPAVGPFIKDGEERFKPITPRHQHESAFYGLAKAAGDTTQSASDNVIGTYTDEAKTKIKSMIGVPTKVSELTNDSGYLTQHQDISNKADKTEIPTKVSDLSNDSEFINGLTELVYGTSTWAEFTAARNAKKIVYCRCPMSGNSYRYAFLAYVSNTNAEFQYYRSVNAHTASQMGDQVFVYTLSNNGTWTTTTREASSKVIAGTGLNSSYTKDKLTLSIKSDYPTKAEVSAMIAEALAAYENGNTE